MKLIEEFSVKHKADIIYAKRMLQSHFNEEKFIDKSFFIFAFMELATNLMKYTDGGNASLLESDGYYLLGVTDYGRGIENILQSLQKGYTTAENSLGLGLYQLSVNDLYDLEIFSTTKKDFHGTVVLLKPKKLQKKVVFFSKPYFNEANNGDFFAQKGKLLLFGDAAGHNKKSHKTAKLIEKRFYSTQLSCIIIDDFFKQLHQDLLGNTMRGAVCLVAELVKNHISICGVGDLCVWLKADEQISLKSLKNGIIGEVYSSVGMFQTTLEKGEFLIATTDGLQEQKMRYFKDQVMSEYSSYCVAFAMVHFTTSQVDDSSIMVVKN